MASISQYTRAQIKGYLEGYITDIVESCKEREVITPNSAAEYPYQNSYTGELNPFIEAIIQPELLRFNQFTRDLSTGLENCIEECARLIALEYHQDARRSYDIRAEVSVVAFAEAERQKEKYESLVNRHQSKLSFEEMVMAVLNARRSDDLETKSVRADLYILAKDGTEFLFEIKAPKPNKGQCLEVTQHLLRFHLLRGASRPQVQAYYAMPYNPYGATKADYKWSQALNYLPFDEAVVIGKQFWNIVGGSTAYEELLDIYLEVGQEKSKYMLDALAFGF